VPDPADLSLGAAVAELRAGGLTPPDLLESCLDRATEGAELGAFVVLAAASAREEAAAARGGPLHGAPVAVKDVLDVTGLPTRAGCAATSPAPATHDAAVVARLRRAGAVIAGKTATHELAYGVQTPAVTNPRDPALTAGGSSGGSAAAVAIGAVPLAIGTDTAGSVRIPAVCCGVHGLVVPPGTLPSAGLLPLAPSFDTFGVLVREPSDLPLAYAALSGEPATPPASAGRLLMLSEAGLDADQVEPAARAGARDVAATLGGPVRVVDLPPFSAWAAPRARVIGAEALAVHRQLGLADQDAELGEDVAALHARAAGISAATVEAGRAELRLLGHRLSDAIGPDDVLLTPALPAAPPARTASTAAATATLTRMVAPVNAAGLAAVALSLGSAAGVQLIAHTPARLLDAVACLPSSSSAHVVAR
jgi:aspartyl-tRNA(Asn)/glutamyl-tRNA(Gln) amidotransferase subunit A